jgi:hypothetical protein
MRSFSIYKDAELLMRFFFMFVPCINSITFLLFQTDAHNYKIIRILKQLKFRLSLQHVSVHAGAISCLAKTTNIILCVVVTDVINVMAAYQL